ncbi:MAG: CDP-diacylglycerol--glycerol-3-phosphate 3-phosphatidyltransferase [Bacteroidetes bacterium QH_2_67_10]|jgi:CDP-diacylglycerol--glycerol-3-phosphate 3-phosphatidyltransferase|nr:MAG: CDP-diacylglycerol--glycerol-3-phosphate 3-phosphatidyltransferase [Bacteroidetes bacterium QH_2_67_10]PSQ71136.1 MAG: CDP-diacylglycerol--glycerol-3-phosphate 3-phosphatidyltransferase [Bacteroidetes bacterium QH_9_67_14]PSQ77550.1 MAG: CDP-diacylglycerol--glycerol-3-phosphate 3-phosphatidyltransferase [Bacteroidetes bacterium QH_8_67_23]PSQ91606.1 MAG: CDP-diacylglycerol--glycerol-3-phosphate 3-phosphatidyltransferase [Bacteroidetes bacterium SW_4_67_19]
MRRHLPNVLTVTRIALTPVVLVLLGTQTLWAQAGALVLFMLASVSDYLDGRLAREMGTRSRLGRFLDPLADKVLVLGTFAMLALERPETVPWWAVGLIAARDVVITALRAWAEARGENLRTLPLAKSKTAAQLFFLVTMLVLLTARQLPGPLERSAAWMLDESLIPYALLMVVVALTVVTGALYVYYQPAVARRLSNRR